MTVSRDGGHAAGLLEVLHGGVDVLHAGVLELLADVLLGDLEVELLGEGVEGQGLTGALGGLGVEVVQEVANLDLAGREPGVEREALTLELTEEVLGDLVKDLLDVVLGKFVELEGLGDLLDDTVSLMLGSCCFLSSAISSLRASLRASTVS